MGTSEIWYSEIYRVIQIKIRLVFSVPVIVMCWV